MSRLASKPTPETIEILACYLGVQASALHAFFAGKFCALPMATSQRLENILQASIEPTLELLPALETFGAVIGGYLKMKRLENTLHPTKQ